MEFKGILNKKGEGHICTAAIILHKSKVLLGNRVYPEKNLSVWNFPGGRCDGGETVKETLIREVFEEIGVREDNFKILDYIGEIKGSWKNDIVHLFYCSIESEPKLMEPEKFKEWKWTNWKDGLKTHFNDNATDLVSDYIRNNFNQQVSL